MRSIPQRVSRILMGAVLTLGFAPAPGLVAQKPDTLTLVQAATLALDAYPSVALARHEMQAAEASASEAKAARLPTLGLGGTLTRFQEPMVVAPLHGFDPTRPPAFDRSLVRGSLDLSYTLFDGGARSGRIEGAEAVRRSAEAGLEATRMDLLHRVVEDYLAVLTREEVAKAHRKRLQALEEELARARQFFDEGAAPRLEVLRARASLGQARADARSAETGVRVARRELARLSGLPEGALSGTFLTPVSGSEEPPGSDSAGPLEPPEVRAAAERLAAARQGRRVAHSAWIPDLSTRAGLDEYGSGDGAFSGEWRASVQLSYPVFTGGARSAANARAEAEVGKAREALALEKLRVRDRSDRALSALDDALARTEALEATVVQLEEVARIEALALDAGSGVQRDLLAAQASLLSARAQLAQARHAASRARASLARLRGELTLDWIRDNLTDAFEEAAP